MQSWCLGCTPSAVATCCLHINLILPEFDLGTLTPDSSLSAFICLLSLPSLPVLHFAPGSLPLASGSFVQRGMQLCAVWLCLARLCGWVGTGWTGTVVYCYRHQVQSRRQVLIGSAQIFLIENIASNERNTLTDKENHLFYFSRL